MTNTINIDEAKNILKGILEDPEGVDSGEERLLVESLASEVVRAGSNRDRYRFLDVINNASLKKPVDREKLREAKSILEYMAANKPAFKNTYLLIEDAIENSIENTEGQERDRRFGKLHSFTQRIFRKADVIATQEQKARRGGSK